MQNISVESSGFDRPASDPRTIRFLKAPITATLLRLAAPNILVMMMQSSVGLIETYFIAKLGVSMLAGLSLVFPILMLMQMTAAGAIGGGILTAVARALGRGGHQEAGNLVWYAVAVAIVLGLLSSAIVVLAGKPLYASMGGRAATLQAALVYSNVIFGGAVLVWLFNALAAVIRGTGDMILPASVICGGAIFLVPLSPALIFGWGPLPRLGITGGAIAVLIYYGAGSAIFAFHLWSGRGVLRPPRTPSKLSWQPVREILRVGGVSSIITATTNLTIATITGFAGTYGIAALAGYGAGARLEYLLVPLVFGIGTPIGAMVGTCCGAGDTRRALRVAWTGALVAFILTETIGLAAACFPSVWLGYFGSDPAMLAAGSIYLRSVGPFYGFFGMGNALFFAAQGSGRLKWPFVASLSRTGLALSCGWLAQHYTSSIHGIFIAASLGMVAFGGINAAATWRQSTAEQRARQ